MFERVVNTPYSVMHTIHPMSMLFTVFKQKKRKWNMALLSILYGSRLKRPKTFPFTVWSFSFY